MGWAELTGKTILYFRWRLKSGNDWDSRVQSGREFQIRGAEKRKAPDPNDSLYHRINR